MKSLLCITAMICLIFIACASDPAKTKTAEAPKTYSVSNKKSINSVNVSSDGKWILVGGEDKKIRLLNAANGETLWMSDEQPDAVLSVAISPDRKYFAATCGDNTQNTAQVVVYDMQTKSEVWGKKGQTNNIQLVTFAADGKSIVVANHFSIAFYETQTGKQLHYFSGHAADVAAPYGHVDAVTSIRFTNDASKIVSVGWDKNVKVWDLKAGHEIKNFPEADAINTCLLSPDANKIITAGAGDLHVWNRTTDRTDTIISYEEEIKCMAALSDEQYFATGDMSGSIVLWRMSDYAKLIEIKNAHQLGAWSMDVFPDGRHFVTSGGDGSIIVWSLDYLLQNNPVADSAEAVKGHIR
ncbi:WD40 repeat domain-containing protein [bacterium]|nr:WD40 repeat domain-containing protein [bacterium]